MFSLKGTILSTTGEQSGVINQLLERGRYRTKAKTGIKSHGSINKRKLHNPKKERHTLRHTLQFYTLNKDLDFSLYIKCLTTRHCSVQQALHPSNEM